MSDLVSKCPGLEPILKDVLAVSGYLWERGWAERNAGNLSVDVTDLIPAKQSSVKGRKTVKLPYTYPLLAERFYLVTGSGRRFRDVPKDAPCNVCILQISKDGAGYRIVWGGKAGPDFRPTSEFPTHLRLHEELRKNDAPEKAVLHTHPTELIALTHLPEYCEESALNKALWSTHPEVKYNLPKGVGFVPYALPGSEALAQASAAGFRRGYPVVLWEMHGCVSKADGIPLAFDLIDIANKAARLLLLCRSAGQPPKGLTQEQLDELVQTFGLKE
jgi:rhamnulose-1-phosphate aldolase